MSNKNKLKTLELIEALHRSYEKEPGILDEEGLNALSYIMLINRENQKILLSKIKK